MDCRERIISNDYADIIVDFELEERLLDRTVSDYCYEQITPELRIYHVRRSELNSPSISDYRYQYLPKCYGLMELPMGQGGGFQQFDTGALNSSGILQVQQPPLSLTGQGCAVCIIDTGIDYTNRVFRRANGESRILAIWDQEDQSGNPPTGFQYGTEYRQSQINAALESNSPFQIVPSSDELLHGTEIAGIAAGSRVDSGYTFLGAAPDADLIIVKLKQAKQYLRDYYLIADGVPCFAETDIISALKYVQSFLVVFERPLSICIPLGSNMGDHAGNSTLARYIDTVLQRRNLAIITPAGNEGDAAHHYRGVITSETIQQKQWIEIQVGANERGFVMEIWGGVPNFFSISVRSPGGEEVADIPFRLTRSLEYRFVFEQTILTADTILVEQSSGQELVFLRFENPTEGIWEVGVMAEDILLPAVFDIWLPITDFLSSQTRFLEPTPNETLTAPSAAQEVITVSAYNDYNGSSVIESSRGYTRNGNIKPDFSAPGVRVPSPYGEVSGTSVSAALTCGAVAQFLQWAVIDRKSPLIDSAQIKNYFIRGAARERTRTWPNREEGYGRLDVRGVFRTLSQ